MEEETIGKIRDSRLSARLLRYLRPYRWWVIVSAFLLVAHSLLAVVGPYLTKVAIDRYLSPRPESSSVLDAWLPDGELEGLNVVALLYLATLAAGFAFRLLQTLVMNYTGQRVMRDLRNEIFRHLQRLDIRFYDRNPLGRLVTRVTSDVDALNEMFTSGVVAVFGDVLTLTFILGAMLYLSPMLTLVLVTVAPLVLAVSIFFRKKARESYREVRVAVAKINSFLQEHITGIAVVQLFNHERRSARRFDEINAEHRDAYRGAIRAHAYFFPAIEWLGMLAVAAVLVYGGYRVVDGGITIGIVVAFIQYGTRVFRPIQDLSEKYNILQSAMASSERIFNLLDTAPEQKTVQQTTAGGNGEPAATAAKAELDVEFQNVWFAYKDEDWVLRDVSFRIEAGETVAIVGHTGAGKTTIISLLLRFYDIQKGKILLAGRDIREWPVHELRRSFGVVLQDSYLFEGTIGGNIRFGNHAVPGERLEQVARDVNLSGFIGSLAGGFEEPIRERGSSLSSGQKQLIGFARALVHNPGFLILDEATSSVDTDTEMKIRDALSRMVTGHTSIIIAHRLSTIHRVDRILVTHKGQVRETGTHQELLAKRGIYWRLYQLQYRDQEAPDVTARAEAGPASRDEGGIAADSRARRQEQLSLSFGEDGQNRRGTATDPRDNGLGSGSK